MVTEIPNNHLPMTLIIVLNAHEYFHVYQRNV